MLLQDIRSGLRVLWHSRGFATLAILCLGFGIGLNTTIFSIVDGVLLKPFPYHDPDRILIVRAANAKMNIRESSVSFADLTDLRSLGPSDRSPGSSDRSPGSSDRSPGSSDPGTRSFSDIAALQFRSIALSDGAGDPERYAAAAVSWNLFPLLGIAPMAGQGFTQDHDVPGAEGVVLISHAVWRDRYQLDPNISGRRVLLNGAPAVIVGVMPERFEFPQAQKLWVPLGPAAARAPRGQRDLFAFARLAPGATRASASEELTARAAALAVEHPNTNDGWTLFPQTLREEFIPPDVSQVIWIMMASVTLVLFIACSNVANLQLARASARLREFSVRAALGAGRARIVRQLLTENVVLSVLSLPLGIGLAEVGTRMIESAMPPSDVPYYITWDVDWRTLLYALVVAVATAVIFGLLPALQTSRRNLIDTLKDGSRGASGRRSRLRSALVVAQVSLALVSLVGALLFVRTFTNLNAYDVGFNPAPLMTMRFYMPGEVYEATDAKARRVEDVIRRVEALPRVRSAFASNLIPIAGGGGGGGLIIDGRPTEPGREPRIAMPGVTPHFHRTLGVQMIDGRDFTETESWLGEPVAIVNKTMADTHWPGARAVGARFRLAGPGDGPWFTVIGVAPDIKHDDIDPDDEPFSAAYVPYRFQQTFSTGLVISVEGDPTSIVPAVRAELKAADPTLPLSFVQTMEEVRRLGFWQYGLFGWIFGVTGIVGLVLALIGVYGVLSYAVTQRSSEIGVRMALGAGRASVMRLIVGHGLALAGIGVAIGLVIAPLGTRAGQSLFYNVSPFDPLTFGSVAIFLMAVALVASWVPARRATRVNPVVVLRGQ
jgi:predicted permease